MPQQAKFKFQNVDDLLEHFHISAEEIDDFLAELVTKLENKIDVQDQIYRHEFELDQTDETFIAVDIKNHSVLFSYHPSADSHERDESLRIKMFDGQPVDCPFYISQHPTKTKTIVKKPIYTIVQNIYASGPDIQIKHSNDAYVSLTQASRAQMALLDDLITYYQQKGFEVYYERRQPKTVDLRLRDDDRLLNRIFIHQMNLLAEKK